MSLAIKDLHVQKGSAVLLDNITFDVETGTFCVLLGPNGSGKTTLLRAIAGSVKYDGTIAIDGEPITARTPNELAQLRTYAQQEPAFPPDMTVEHFVMLARAPYQRRLRGPSKDDHEITQQTLTQCNIAHLARRKLGSLSGGERRRAALAQALTQQTPLVLLDEPTTALDVGQQQGMLELIDTFRAEQNVTFVVALHDLTLTRQYATNVVFLRGGRLVDAGPPESVLRVESLEHHYETALAGLSDETTMAIVPRRQRRV